MVVYGFTITSYLAPSEANSWFESQEISNILHNWKAHSCVHCHRFLTWARLIQSTSTYPVSLVNSLILSSHLCLGSASFIFSSHSLTKTVYAYVPSHACCATFGEQHKYWSSSSYTVSFSLLSLPPSQTFPSAPSVMVYLFCTSPLLFTLLHSIIPFLFVKDTSTELFDVILTVHRR